MGFSISDYNWYIPIDYLEKKDMKTIEEIRLRELAIAFPERYCPYCYGLKTLKNYVPHKAYCKRCYINKKIRSESPRRRLCTISLKPKKSY